MNERIRPVYRLLNLGLVIALLNGGCSATTSPKDTSIGPSSAALVEPGELECSKQGIVESYKPTYEQSNSFGTSRFYLTEGENNRDTGIYTYAIEPGVLSEQPWLRDLILRPSFSIDTLQDTRTRNPRLITSGRIGFGFNSWDWFWESILLANYDQCNVLRVEWKGRKLDKVNWNGLPIPFYPFQLQPTV